MSISTPSAGAILIELSRGFMVAKSLQVASELNIADLIGDSPKSVDELAAATQTNSLALYRLLRALASKGVFREVSNRRFENTDASHLLRSGVVGSLKEYITYTPNSTNYKVWSQLGESVRTGKPVFESIMGKTYWDYLQANPAIEEQFNGAMEAISRQNATGLLQSYPLSSFSSVMDVGGGNGYLVGEILANNPKLKGAVLEVETVVSEAKTFIQEKNLSSRCDAIVGDFLDSIPKGFDLYILKRIVHDWPEEGVLRILKNCQAAMQPSSRLLIIEYVMDTTNDPHPGKWLDLHMMVILGGRERTEEEYKQLLAKAGLVITKIVELSGHMRGIECKRIE